MNPTEPVPPVPGTTVVPPGEHIDADPPTGGVVPTTTVVAPPVPVTTVAVSEVGSDDAAIQKLVTDSKTAVNDAAAAIVKGIGAAFSGVAADIVPIEADLIPAATALIEAKTNPQIGTIAKAIIGIATPIAAPLEQMLNARIIAGLAILQSDLSGFKL
jgi:hypothetical protein